MRSAPIAIASIVATVAFRSGAVPNAVPKHVSTGVLHGSTARAPAIGPAALRFGRSIGSPTEGRLIGGMHLDEGPHMRVVPVYEAGDARWGLEPLVAMIERAAHAVRRRFPDAVMSVGHLSRSGGGDLDRHRSHESGRDADIGFFVRSSKGKQLFAPHFVTFRGDATSASWPGAYFDDAKNWSLVESMVGDPEAHVTHVFVAAPLRARLLAYAERTGAPPALRVRAAELMQQPRGTLPHDDHFHVRIGCPPHMSGCVENPSARVMRPPMGATVHGRRGVGAPVQASEADRPLDVSSPPTPARSLGPRVTTPPRHPAASPTIPDTAPQPGARPTDDHDAPSDPVLPPVSIPSSIDDVDG